MYVLNCYLKNTTLHVLKKHTVRRDCCHNDNYPFIVIDCVFMYGIYMPARNGNNSIWTFDNTVKDNNEQ